MSAMPGLDLLRQQQQDLQALILGQPSARRERLLAGGAPSVYQEAYGARLLSALRDNYAVLHLAMGAEAFDALGSAYLAAHPSNQPSIRWFGDQLAAYMSGPFAERLPHPALVDLARMDWALRAAFDGPDAAPMTRSQLAALAPQAWAALQLRLQPTAQVLSLDWTVEPTYLALSRSEIEGQGEAPEPQALKHALLVWREGDETRWRSLEAWEAELLVATHANSSFADLGELAAQTFGAEAAAGQLVQALQTWVAQGLLAEPELSAA
ncbi:DNA-binding domain-containing protein [Paucibacter sp. Y2R2-4]|uniref:HvfC/BufC N-terminal domain-containing protein n=1 Tax=Paucibacter sp. Y2R2-4 TaxID=2893553 RepID=UPI0021E3746F|nr:DNA-binding domain-containing protein [Paucibacter sp. Y2R2-4]MCV2350714.1 DNA-binding domain-containing protein [Paucibacter sp. Y2R2-4]